MVEEFRSLQQMAGETMAKMTIPSPSLFHFVQEYNGNEIYSDTETLYGDIIQVYRSAIQAFYDAGCRYLQLDDTTWGRCAAADIVLICAAGALTRISWPKITSG